VEVRNMFEAWLVALGITLLLLVGVMAAVSIVERRSPIRGEKDRPTPSLGDTAEDEVRTPRAA
jgi:hypothetical protein